MIQPWQQVQQTSNKQTIGHKVSVTYRWSITILYTQMYENTEIMSHNVFMLLLLSSRDVFTQKIAFFPQEP